MKGRPRKLFRELENVLLEEVRVGRYFRQKRIAERYGLTPRLLEQYVQRAQMEGRL